MARGLPAAVGIAVMCPRSAPIQTIAQQATGMNSIMYYGTQVLTVAGFSASAALIANVANGVLAVVGSAVCLFFLMDRVPRRTLIIGGFIATTTCHALIVLSSYLLPEGLTKAFVILTFMVLFAFCMQLALNVPVWVVLSELFPLRLRGLGMGVCVLMLWVANAVIAFAFPILVDTIRIQGAFPVFVVLGLVAIVFLKKMLPETGKLPGGTGGVVLGGQLPLVASCPLLSGSNEAETAGAPTGCAGRPCPGPQGRRPWVRTHDVAPSASRWPTPTATSAG